MELLDVKTIVERSIRGSMFTIGASGITAVSGLTRSILLARLLLPEQFGVVALAMFFLSLIMQVQRFGLNSAFIHRTDNSPANLATFASLRVGLTIVAVLIALTATPILAHLYPEQPKLAPMLIVLAIFEVIRAFNSVAETILQKGLHFQRLAFLNVVSSLAATVIAPTVAWLGGGIWALVTEHVTGILVTTVGLWLYRPPIKRLGWSLDAGLAHWYIRFGMQIFVAGNLTFLLDRFDDFWTGTFLGATSLGLYSRAYEFARYPRRILARPILQVFFSTFARLQNDRLRLSKAFYRTNSLIVRVGFLVFGSFTLVVPEFIRVFLGDKWLPMTLTFQLMLVYTLFDPLIAACGNLLAAIGQPQVVVQTKLIQITIFVPSVIGLSFLYGIDGVAVAADFMLILGVGLLFRQVKQYIDFSVRRMFLVPILNLGLGLITLQGLTIFVIWPNDWIALVGKILVVWSVYLTLSVFLERREYLQNAQFLWGYLRSH